jgi:ABC-type sugar transport system permease subunit
MDTLKGIEKLAQKAREEKNPVFGVTDKVLLQIASARMQTVGFMAFDLFAGLSAAAASIILLLAVNTWTYLSNPMMEFLAPLQEVPLW